jgi:C1A family cysteine protease
MQECLAEGYPFVFGLKLFNSYENKQTKSTGIISIPLPHEQEIDNHCMMAVGWKFISNKRYFIVQNSLGETWGDNGFCYVPFDYLGNNHLAGDIWTIRLDK